jgi:aryl-alcohol dehydrogenase-like predicted oxidoreductase
VRYLDAGPARRISRIGLGTYQLTGGGDAEREARAIVRRALDLGITLFDTADIYGFRPPRLVTRALRAGIAFWDPAAIDGFGRGERILGQALGERRESVVLATKFYPTRPVARAVEQRAVASANRLGTRCLDLYQVHQPDGRGPHGGVMRGLRALREAGLVGEVGLSNGSLAGWRAAEAALGGRVLSNQVRYSLVDRSAERDLLPFAAAGGRVIIAYRPLELGLLSGRYHPAGRPIAPAPPVTPLFWPANLARAGRLITVLREVAEAHAATPAQIALAWVIRHPVVIAIPGASSVRQLESNAAAADIELADGEARALDDASAQFRPVPGPSWPSRQVRAALARR